MLICLKVFRTCDLGSLRFVSSSVKVSVKLYISSSQMYREYTILNAIGFKVQVLVLSFKLNIGTGSILPYLSQPGYNQDLLNTKVKKAVQIFRFWFLNVNNYVESLGIEKLLIASA
jgi:hypothetical protein